MLRDPLSRPQTPRLDAGSRRYASSHPDLRVAAETEEVRANLADESSDCWTSVARRLLEKAVADLESALLPDREGSR